MMHALQQHAQGSYSQSRFFDLPLPKMVVHPGVEFGNEGIAQDEVAGQH